MIDHPSVWIAVAIYCSALILVALWLGGRSQRARRLHDTGLPHALAMATFCTSWTFYGSVGNAVTSGVLFLSVYVGASIGAMFWPLLLRKLVRAKQNFRVTSIADFLSVRYGRSQRLAALATVIAFLGVIPYIALQLKAVTTSYALISGADRTAALVEVGPWMVVLLTAFTVLFGVRHLDPTERHPGMMAALAAGSLVKLVALLAAGVFVTYGVFEGFSDIASRWESLPAEIAAGVGEESPPFTTWLCFSLLAASSVILLPRQFHIGVVENPDERSIETATWFIPLYLFLSAIFVLPIAAGGLILGHAPATADSFVLAIPLEQGQAALALFVFVGGFAAATGMVMVSAMTLSTMGVNHLALPLLERMGGLHMVHGRLLRCRGLAVGLVVAAGYVFALAVGESTALVGMGMLAFAALFQLAPPLVAGVFWKGGSRQGAMAGMAVGFGVWTYTLLLPSLSKAGWIDAGFLNRGPFDVYALRPEQLFGVQGLDPVTHGTLWSLVGNCAAFWFFSRLYAPGLDETEVASQVVDSLDEGWANPSRIEAEETVLVEEKLIILRRLFATYLGDDEGREALRSCVLGAIGRRSRISVFDLSRVRASASAVLSGAIGAASAEAAIRESELVTATEEEELALAYSHLLADLKLPPSELKRKIDYHQERQQILAEQAGELERKVEARTQDLVRANAELELATVAAQAASESKTAFLANVTHELRTPLTAILGYTDLLLDVDCAERDASTYLQTIKSNGDHLLTLINDVLDFTKIEADHMELEILPVVVPELLENVRSLLKMRADEKGLEFSIGLVGSTPVEIRSDPVRLKQILVNLAGNAIKFTEEGFVAVEASYSEEGGEGFLELRVRDSGIGMSPKQQSSLFRPFTQADVSTSRRFGGTGLGLSISKRLAEMLGGDLAVTSAEGEGSCFVARVTTGPLDGVRFVQSLEEAPATLKDAEAGEIATLSGKILLVEDALVNQRLGVILLEKAGFEVRTAANGQEAVDCALEADVAGEPFDIILMDMQMPIMDGKQATRLLRQRGYRRPIIALTANADEESREACMAAGCDDFATKPLVRKKLFATLERWLRSASIS